MLQRDDLSCAARGFDRLENKVDQLASDVTFLRVDLGTVKHQVESIEYRVENIEHQVDLNGISKTSEKSPKPTTGTPARCKRKQGN